MQRIILIIIVAGGSAGYAGCGITGITDDAVYPAGGLVLCPFFPRFHAWLLYRSWFGSYRFWQKHHASAAQNHAPLRAVAYFDYVYDFAVVRPDAVGAHHVAGNSRLFAFYVADSGD